MAVTSFSTVVGVFNDQGMAEQAMKTLNNAGFTREQMHILVPGNSGGFFGDLKSFFTGEEVNGNPIHDLTRLGLPGAEVQYYSSAYNQGYTILAVNALDRQEQALTILHQCGGYTSDAYAHFFKSETPDDLQQSQSYAQPTDSMTYVSPDNSQTLQAQDQAQATSEAPFQNNYRRLEEDEIETPVYRDNKNSSTWGNESSNDQVNPGENAVYQDNVGANTAYQDNDQVNAVYQDNDDITAPGHNFNKNAYQDTDEFEAITIVDAPGVEQDEADVDQVGVVEPVDAPETEQEETDADQVDVVENPDTQDLVDETEQDDEGIDPVQMPANYQSEMAKNHSSLTSQTGVDTPEQVDNQAATSAYTSAAQPETANSLQRVRAQIEETQQQLQEAKDQLEALKQHESQYTEAQAQLQSLRAELEATQKELQEARARTAQYH